MVATRSPGPIPRIPANANEGDLAPVNAFLSRIGAGVAANNAQSNVNVIALNPSSGNTSGDSGSYSGSLVVAGVNNVTAQLSSGSNRQISLFLSGPVLFSAGVSTGGATAGSTGVVASRMVLAGSNGISLSQSTSGQSATVSILGPGYSAGVYASSNTTGAASSTTVDFRSLTLRGMGAVSVGASASEVIISAPNTVAQTNQTIGAYFSSNTTAQSSSSTYDARTLSFRGAGIVSVGASAGEIVISATGGGAADGGNILAAGTRTAGSNSSVLFSDANGVSWGLNAVNGSVITATVKTDYLTTARASNDAIGLNTAQSNVTWTVNSSGLSLDARGYAGTGTSATNATLTLNSNGLAISVAAPGAGGGIAAAAGTQTATSGTVVWSNSNNVSFGMTNSSIITASASFAQSVESQSIGMQSNAIDLGGSTAGTSGYASGGQIQYALYAGANITLSQSLNGATGLLTINGPAAGGATLSQFEPFPLANPITTTWVPGVGSWYFQPFMLPANLAPGRINYLISNSNSSQGIARLSSGNLFASNTTGTRSAHYVMGDSWALYTRGTGTQNSILSTIWSNTRAVSLSQSVSVILTNASQIKISASQTLSYIGSIGTDGNYTLTTYTASTATSTAGSSCSTTIASAAFSSIFNILSGPIMQNVGITKSLTPGNYWLAGAYSTSITTGGTTIQDLIPFVHEVGIYGIASMNYRGWPNTASSTGSQYQPGAGVWSVASAAPPNTVAFTDIRSQASHLTQYFNHVQSSL